MTEGEPLLTLHTDGPERFERALESLEGGYDVQADGSSYEQTRSSSTGSADPLFRRAQPVVRRSARRVT